MPEGLSVAGAVKPIMKSSGCIVNRLRLPVRQDGVEVTKYEPSLSHFFSAMVTWFTLAIQEGTFASEVYLLPWTAYPVDRSHEREKLNWTEHHSLVETARRVPGCVIGLIYALRFHGLSNEMPHQIWGFISRKARKPRVDYPPLLLLRCEPEQLYGDTIRPLIEGIEVCMTDIPRTLADCFLHRKAVGIDVAIQAMKEALQQGRCTPGQIAEAAKNRRAWNTLRPYLEAML